MLFLKMVKIVYKCLAWSDPNTHKVDHRTRSASDLYYHLTLENERAAYPKISTDADGRPLIGFILVRGRDLIAIEAKSGNTFMDAWCKGLRAVAQLKGLQRRIIVCLRGPAMRTKDGIDVLFFQHLTLTEQLAENTLWN